MRVVRQQLFGQKLLLIAMVLAVYFATPKSLFCELPSNFYDENAGSKENPFLISSIGNLGWMASVRNSKNFQTKNGENVFVWDRKDENNQDVASGIYLYRVLSTQNQKSDNKNMSEQTGKLIILK